MIVLVGKPRVGGGRCLWLRFLAFCVWIFVEYVVTFVCYIFVVLVLPVFSRNPELFQSEAIVKVQKPAFGELWVADQFVVLVWDISVCYVLICVFKVVTGSIRPL